MNYKYIIKRYGELICFIMLLIMFHGSANGQENKEDLLSGAEMELYAKKIAMLQYSSDQLYMFNERIVKVPGAYINAGSKALKGEYKNIIDNDQEFFGVTALETYKNMGFIYYYCSRIPDLEQKHYHLAMSHDGSFYLLKGFDKNNFTELLKYKVKNIKTDYEAKQIAWLYVTTQSKYCGSVIIDSININHYKKEYKQAKPITVVNKSGGFVVRLYTYWKNLDADKSYLCEHILNISKDLLIKYQYRLN